MNAAPASVRHSFAGACGDAAALPRRRDDAPSAFAQTLRRLEQDMWPGAAAGHAPSAPHRTAPPRAAPTVVSANTPNPARQARATAGAAAVQPGADHHAPARRDPVVAEPAAPASAHRRPPRPGGDAQSPSHALAPPLSASTASGARCAASVDAPQPARATSRPSPHHSGGIESHAASGSRYRLSVLTGVAGVSIAIRAAGIDDSTLAQRAFTELRRLGVPAARLFINGRLFIETHRLPGGTHGD